MSNDVLVFVEFKDGQPTKPALQALGAGASLAGALGGSAVALVAANGADGAAAELGQFGASKVLLASGDAFNAYSQDGTARLVAAQAQALGAAAVLAAASPAGKDFMPRAATRCNTALASDIVELSAEGGKPQAVRPVYAGKALARVTCEGALFATLRPNVFATPEASGDACAVEAVSADFGAADLKAIVAEVVAGVTGKMDVADAEVVCSGGRGMRDPSGEGATNWENLEKLASLLGGAVGASRAVVDAGWRPHGDQVGQTGKTVSPKLYIACAISGAIQHIAGMSGSKVIVAINKDDQAPIFKLADYGIVGTVEDVLPVLIEQVAAAVQG